MSGPTCVVGSRPSPTRRAPAAAAIRSVNSGAAAADTKKRCGDTHTWPPLRNFAAVAPATTCSRFTSGKMSTGALPPSSSDRRVTVFEAPSIRSLPTRVLPVKWILARAGWASMACPIGPGSPFTRFTTPFGAPASVSRRATFMPLMGVNSDGRITMVHPAASAAPPARAMFQAGKFQAVMRPTTPSGCLRTSIRLVDVRAGITRP